MNTWDWPPPAWRANIAKQGAVYALLCVKKTAAPWAQRLIGG